MFFAVLGLEGPETLVNGGSGRNPENPFLRLKGPFMRLNGLVRTELL